MTARADRLDDIENELTALNMRIFNWYGVRVFNDAIPADTPVPGDKELAARLASEDQVSRRDRYRWTASQLDIIADDGSR